MHRCLGRFAIVVLIFVQGCGTSRSEPGCKTDVDCPGGFCDRRVCATVAAEGRENYGIECEPPPISPMTGRPDLRINRCGAFLCIEKRCTSCATDDECKSVLGSPTCGTVAGWPGRSCGNYSIGDGGAGESTPPDAAAAGPGLGGG